MFSVSNLPWINAVWFGRMTSGSIDFRHFTSIFEIVLYVVLQQEIGLKSEMDEAPGLLGTRVRIVALVAVGKKAVIKNLWIAEVVSEPTTAHVSLNKAEVKLSGPGDL